MSPKPRRRWYQFSLLTLLIGLTLFSLPLGYVAWEREQCRRGEAAIEMLDTLIIEHPRSPMFAGVKEVNRPSSKRPTWLISVLGDDRFREVHAAEVYGDFITDADLRHLMSLPNLTDVWIDAPNVTDDGISNLRGLKDVEKFCFIYNVKSSERKWGILRSWKKLQNLSFEGSHLGKDGMLVLPAAKQLKSLSLRRTNISDAGLEEIASLTTLEELDLGYTGVRDAGLKHLSGLTNLRMLDLYETKVTGAGVEKLQSALPNVAVGR